jgi:elongation of very long chain fatty acids protein 4
VNIVGFVALWVELCKIIGANLVSPHPLPHRSRQVSFLHVYHHTSISWAWWFALKLYPGGDVYFGALLNSWIHVMMYSYYTLSLLKIQCPWKKYLTQAQLLQFLSVLVYSACSLFWMPEDGNWKQYLAYAIQVFEMSSMFVLFLHFYLKAYSKRWPASSRAKQLTSSSSSSASSTDSDSDVVAEQESVSSVSSDEQGIADDQCS